VVTHHQVARDTAEAGLIRLVRALAVILPLVAIAQAAANSGDYSRPAAAVVVWLAVLGAGVWLVPRLRAGGLATGEVAAAIAIAVAAVAAIGAVRRAHDAAGSVDLAILGTVWLLVLVVMSRSARVWVPAGLLVYAVQGALLIRDEGLNPRSLSQLGAAGYIIAAVLIAFAASRPTLAIRASMAARQASLASRLAAERAAASAIAHERRGRLAVLEKEALPLLRAIADGTLDPAGEGVRGECARHAAELRRSLTGDAPRACGPVAGRAAGLAQVLEPALRTAAARELPVNVQLIGDPGTAGPRVARALLATVDAVLSALAPQHVTLTVLAAGEDVELYLTFGGALPVAPDLTRFGLDVPAAARWRACVSAAETGGGCLEVSWRKDAAGGRTAPAGTGAR
jgi:hypothetical protein